MIRGIPKTQIQAIWEKRISSFDLRRKATPVEGVTVERFLPGVSGSAWGTEGDGVGGWSSTDSESLWSGKGNIALGLCYCCCC